MPDSAVHVEGVVKRFGTTTALAGVDLDVEEATVFGLLGANGAGKTTLIRVLATLLAPDAGRAEVFGRDVVHDAAGGAGAVGADRPVRGGRREADRPGEPPDVRAPVRPLGRGR